MFKFNIVSFLVFISGSALLAFQIPDIAERARLYPLVLIGMVVFCSAVIAVKEIRERATTPLLDVQLAQIASAERPVIWRLLGFIVIWIAYPLAMSQLGFIVATIAALGLSLCILKARRVHIAFLSAALFALGFSVLFATILFIPMPQGPLDELLTEAIYMLQN